MDVFQRGILWLLWGKPHPDLHDFLIISEKCLKEIQVQIRAQSFPEMETRNLFWAYHKFSFYDWLLIS